MNKENLESFVKNIANYYCMYDENGLEISGNLPTNEITLLDKNIAIFNNGFYFKKEKVINSEHNIYKAIIYEKIPDTILNLMLLDTKTGTYTYNIFKLLVKNKIKDNQHLILCVIDIDNFKKLNDTKGHQYGDDVLVALVKYLAANIRKDEDLLCRFGGDEFLICFSDDTINNVINRIEKIKARLNDGLYFNGKRQPLSLSMGVTTYNPKRSFEDNFKVADMALYQSKNTGKNKVIQMEDLIKKRNI